ncbi:MAG: hypothetical protein VKL41_15525 [Snowella sp.]|jgi:hypothetical protein|nr:hypothetical protein [Snowella sp.]
MISLQNHDINNPQRFSPLSEEQQFNEVCILLQQNVVAALKLANSKLKTKKYFENLLEKGLESANASEIEIWLKYLVPRLGFRYVVNVLDKKVESQSEQVKKALYWLPKFLQKNNKKEVKLFKDLEQKVMLENEDKTEVPLGKTYKLILKIKDTNEYAIFGGYQLGSNGSGVIVEILDSNFYQTGGVKVVSPKDLEILDPQPYK